MATLVVIPEIGYGIREVTIVEWLKEENKAVREGEPLLLVETEKASLEVTAPGSGVLLKILAPPGNLASPGGVVAIIGNEGEEIATLVVEHPQLARPKESVQIERKDADPGSTASRLTTPAARRIANEHGLDLSRIKGTGPDGRISKDDVLRAVRDSPSPPKKEEAAGDGEIIPLSGIRKTIAERLSLSKRIAADVTTVAEVDMEKVVVLKQKVAASFSAFVVTAVARSIRSFPMVNATLMEDQIVIKRRVNIGVAVDTNRGLLVPVVRDADQKDLMTISEEITELSNRARNDLLSLHDLSDGTFTVTNSGRFGSLFFTPIINYPQAAILGMGKVFEAAIVRSHQVVVGSLMYLCLTYDHRLIDGAVAVRFLQQVKSWLENPQLLLTPSSVGT